jgi:poly(A) polymerase
VTRDQHPWRLPSAPGAEWLSRPETQVVFAAIETAGHQVRAVGGAVRNTLLGRAVADVDLATTARPEQTMAAAQAAGLTVIATGLQHGTVTIISGHIPHEVTTLRADVTTDGRHATVAFTGDWAADASRRDLTINALYCDRHGVIFDPLGGRADLETRRVRFIGDAAARIREDYLRILRFFRFHAEYAAGLPDPAGVAASVQERTGFARLSGERIHHELLRLLVAPGAMGVIETMAHAGLLTELLPVVPRLSSLRRLIAIEQQHGLKPSTILRLAVLTIGVDEDATCLNRRLKVSAGELQVLQRAAAAIHHTTSLALPELQRRLYHQGPAVYAEQTLLAWSRADVAADDAAWHAALTLPSRWTAPKLPVGGAAVVALGVAPGPRIGRILAAFETWWIAAGFPSEADLITRKLAEITHVN